MKQSSIISMALLACALLLPAKVRAADYNWGQLLGNNATWFSGTEARATADSIVKYQLSDGGWRKDMDNTSQTGEWAKSTVDNDATTSQIIFLARVYRQTNNSRYLQSCQRGIDLFIDGQYANGGWPQVFGAGSNAYNRHITFNDGAMVRVLEIMKSVSEKSGDFTFIDDTRAARAKTAVEKGIDCILKSQIVFTSGEKTAWCQQHDMNTLAPVGARAYELPSVSGSESVGIVNFLKKYHTSLGNSPRLDVVRAINAAVTWMDKVKIVGIRVDNITTNGSADRIVVNDPSSTIWARFYELNTNRPIFVGRDGIIKYALSEIEQERRAGYAYYGRWPRDLVAAGLLPEPSEPIRDPLNGTLIKTLVINDASRYSSWSIQSDLQAGNTIYGDRAFTFTAVPNVIRGLEWIKTACDSKDFTNSVAAFTAPENITVYVGVDTRVTQTPSWLGDWTSTGQSAAASNDNIVYNLYSRNYDNGSTVTLGSNSVSAGVVMYTVFVAPRSTSSAIPVPGASGLIAPIAVKGKMLNVSAAEDANVRVRLFDVRGRTVASFNSVGGGSFSLAKMPAGRYLVDVRGAGIRQTTPVIVK